MPICGSGKFEAQQSAAGFEHPMHFPEAAFKMRQVPDAESDHGDIERSVGKGNFFGISLNIVNMVQIRMGIDFVAAGHDHGVIDIINNDLPLRSGATCRLDRQIARPAAYIQYTLGRADIQHPDGIALPHMLNAQAEQSIHKIVLGRHTIEVAQDSPVFITLGKRANSEFRPTRIPDIFIQLFPSSTCIGPPWFMP
jgi:hypothetical protein